MSNSPLIKSTIAKTWLGFIPSLLRKSLLDDAQFCQEFSFKTNAVLTLRDFGCSFQRAELFNAIREILPGMPERVITDTDGREWKLKSEVENGGIPVLVIFSKKKRRILTDFSVLSPSSSIRLQFLTEVASNYNLPINAQQKWRNKLSTDALEDKEFEHFNSDISDTPVRKSQLIRSNIEASKFSVSMFVPNSRKYFDRLVGGFDESATIKDYAVCAGRHFFTELSRWQTYNGFLHSLLLSSHSALTSEIGVEKLQADDIVRAFNFLVKSGDIMSRLGAIEVGFRILPDKPEIEPLIIQLIKSIRDDDVDSSKSGFKLFSALFVFVDGELSRTRLLCAEPPYYRRLASLSQAALIHRQFMKFEVDEEFIAEIINARGEQYYMQSFADMRLEPRWNPDFASPAQMKSDFLGRIMIAATKYEKNIVSGNLHDLVFGKGTNSVHAVSEFPNLYFPGPLEGAEDCPSKLTDELITIIDKQLNTNELGPSSFTAFVNSALIFRVEIAQVELAAKALKLGNYQLVNVKNKTQLLGVMNGLATVAAVARSPMLADELRILLRRYMQDPKYRFSINQAMKICLVAASSRKNLNEWREFFGEWLTELAFGDLIGDDGINFQSSLQSLIHAVPELWVSCSKADAAIKAYNEGCHLH